MNRKSKAGALGGLLIWLPAVLCLLLAFFFASCDEKDKGDETIKLGAMLPLTGDSAAWGEQGRWGIEFAIQEANQSGGIDGKQLEVIFEDSQAIPRIGIAAANKLVNVDRVPVIIGDIVSATTLAVAPIVEESEVALIAISASAPAITQAGEFVYRVWPSDNLEGEAAAEWAISQNYSRVGVLYIANDYGRGLADVFGAKFKAEGREVLSVQSYPKDQTDFRPNLTRLKAGGCDCVYIISYYKDAALALRQAKEIGFSSQFIGATAVESDDLIRLAGDAAEGLVYPTIVSFDSNNLTPKQKKFVEEFESKNGKAPDWAAVHAYDATVVAVETLKAGALNGGAVKAEIDRRGEFVGITGPITFDENGDVIGKPVAMKTVRGGKFVTLGSDQNQE